MLGAASFIDTLKDGYETMPGRQFEDGTELSIGQWQKLALARTFLRPDKILVQGEPTSSWTPRQKSNSFVDHLLSRANFSTADCSRNATS
jgi:ATP-binding cassette, subfamily B, bacterial